MSLGMHSQACPCGATSYDGCCGRFHRGEAQASTPEELMRSRFSAYALGNSDYVWRTWHPRTRPDRVTLDATTHWSRLEIVEAIDDIVEFRAFHDSDTGPGVLHERSRFEQRAGRWLYAEGL